ncbi:hypothetical protein ElyMa_006968200 [Elysia marginata]|uniref:Uncharacterized protein n=1 Tax=Elysia marginata TaxID=1093978 RepID=A0AAV4JLX0_9GAST|nr:hypothetical protein ElyMa_006968200 [Elysia marginata]
MPATSCVIRDFPLMERHAHCQDALHIRREYRLQVPRHYSPSRVTPQQKQARNVHSVHTPQRVWHTYRTKDVWPRPSLSRYQVRLAYSQLKHTCLDSSETYA